MPNITKHTLGRLNCAAYCFSNFIFSFLYVWSILQSPHLVIPFTCTTPARLLGLKMAGFVDAGGNPVKKSPRLFTLEAVRHPSTYGAGVSAAGPGKPGQLYVYPLFNPSCEARPSTVANFINLAKQVLKVAPSFSFQAPWPLLPTRVG